MILDADNELLVNRIAFSRLKGINALLAEDILARTGSEKEFFRCPEKRLSALMGYGNKVFDDGYRVGLLEASRREADFIATSGIRPLYFADEDYPSRLRHCEDAPLMLYSLGDIDYNDGLIISIVGTRHATPYGIDFTNKLIAELATKVAKGVTVVSGLAFGVDITAHRQAIKEGLKTVAVLAHGLNTIYPSVHRADAAKMVHEGGGLLTEYGSDSPVHKGNFIARNRIVAGMCDCLVVAESAEKGGALITAKLAFDYQRDVFALPGRTSDRYSRGCNKLIARNVAVLVQDADQLIEAMGWPVKEEGVAQPTLFPQLSEQEQAVVDFLTTLGEATINRLSVGVDISVGRLTALLINMEFKGLVIKYPGGKYRLA